jgi:hypothetical protein
MVRRPTTLPTKSDLYEALERIEIIVSEMIGRWDDSLPGQTRAELMPIRDIAMRILIQARLRPT